MPPAKFKAGETDEMFLTAFRNAINLGPWEPDILFEMSKLGYSAWWILPKADKRLLLENSRRALTRDPKQLYKLASNRDKRYLYCYVAKGNDEAMHLCRKPENNISIGPLHKKRQGNRANK